MRPRKKSTQLAVIIGALSPIYALAGNIEEPIQPQIPASVLSGIWSTCSGGKYEQNPAKSFIYSMTQLHKPTPSEILCVKVLEERHKQSHKDQTYFESKGTDDSFRVIERASSQNTDNILSETTTKKSAPFPVTDSVVIKRNSQALPTLKSYDTKTASDLN